MSEEKNVHEEVHEEELEANESDDESTTDEAESGEATEVEDDDAVSDEDDSGDTGDGGEADDTHARRERAQAQIDRLKEENRTLKDRLKEGDKKGETVASNSELVERTYLSAYGYKDKDVQNEVIRLARKFDMSVDQALDDADIKSRADALIKQKQAAQSVSKGTGGASSKKKGLNYHLSYFKKHGDFAPDASPDMIAKVSDELAKE